ncbi:MAG: homoserine dehydrogenase [Clostridia bacterium]|nr:homoserine dehydrogenase [Clostridia bacterium]
MKQVNLGFLGCGNIGGGVYRLLQEMQEELLRRDSIKVSVTRILVKDIDEALQINAAKGLDVPRALLTEHVEDITSDPTISIVCEFMGGEQPAASFMEQSLAAGKHVVTANKVALALNWARLQRTAEEQHVGLWYEASVGGVIPIIRVLNVNLESDQIDRVFGIINGTTNYILTRMASEGKDYAEVLADAQRLGLAEPNPATDVEGMDAAYKLSILASLAFHGRVTYDKVYREGITAISAADIAFGKEMGYTLKLLGIAKKQGNTVETRVHPTFLPKDHPLANVDGSLNAIFVHGKYCRDMMLQGRGAGDMPTASAICGDIVEAALSDKVHYPTFDNTDTPAPDFVFTDDWITRAYVRLSAVDAPGVLARVSESFAAEQVSIASMIQKEAEEGARVPMIMITHPAPEQAIRRALARLAEDECTVEQMIRVED